MSLSESQSPSASSIPDRITAIRAWRAWALRDDGRLFSLNAGMSARYLWPTDRPLEALCLKYGHDAPQENCSCGIYAHKDREWIIANTVSMGMNVGAIGIVKLSGRVVEAEKGYRAQYAEPEMLAVMEDRLTFSADARNPHPLSIGGSGFYGWTTTAPIFLSVSSAAMPMGYTQLPSPPSPPSNYGAIRRSRGQCGLCGTPLNKKGTPIPAGVKATCVTCAPPEPPKPEPEPVVAVEPEWKSDPEPQGIVALVAKHYPNCVVVPYSKLLRTNSEHPFRSA